MDLSKIIREFDKLPYDSYDIKRPTHEPNGSYFCLAIQLVKCMMIDDSLNSYNYPVRTEMTDTKKIMTLHFCSTDKSELKEFLVD